MALLRTSEKKLAANRANARLSKGPTTPAGKEKVSRNACKHHLYARTYTIHPAWEARIHEIVDPIAATIQNPIERANLVHYFVLKLWIMELDSYEGRLINQSIVQHRGNINRGIHHFCMTNPLFLAIESRIHTLNRYASRARTGWLRSKSKTPTGRTVPQVVDTKPVIEVQKTLVLAASAGGACPVGAPPCIAVSAMPTESASSASHLNRRSPQDEQSHKLLKLNGLSPSEKRLLGPP